MFFVNVQSYAIFCTLPKKTIVFFAFFTKEQFFLPVRLQIAYPPLPPPCFFTQKAPPAETGALDKGEKTREKRGKGTG